MQKVIMHWRQIVYSFCGLKLLTMLFPGWGTGIGGDFLSWTIGANLVFQTISTGKLPPLSTYGIYLGIEIVLAPFYWLWTILPVEHPNVNFATLDQRTIPAISLIFLMKIPIFLFDIVTLILLMRIVRHVSNSEQKSIAAGLTWFVNPYNFYILYFFGAMDIIAIGFFLLALNFELEGRWFRCGIATILSALLRIYALAVYPFFIPLMKTKSSRTSLILGSAMPVAFAIGLLYLSGDTLATVFNIPAKEFWLLEFLGFNVLGMQFIRWSPVLMIFQLYVVARFWRRDTNIIYLASVSLLALLLGATLYGGEAQHFLWVCPLLSACIAMHPEDLWTYILTFFTALLSPTVNPFYVWTPEPVVLDTFLAGAFYAMKATYLLRINLWNLRLSR